LPFLKWPPQYHTNSTLSDFNDISMWVDYDVPNWFLTSKNLYRSPFSKWPPQYRNNSTLFDFKGSFWFIFYAPTPRRGRGVYCFTSILPSVQDIFRRIFLSNYQWQKSDIWSQASYRYAILW
jgi:hypothetical protein